MEHGFNNMNCGADRVWRCECWGDFRYVTDVLQYIDELQDGVLGVICGVEGSVMFQSSEHLLFRVDEVNLLQKCRILRSPHQLTPGAIPVLLFPETLVSSFMSNPLVRQHLLLEFYLDVRKREYILGGYLLMILPSSVLHLPLAQK